MFAKFISRLKKQYKYARWYQNYRLRCNFTAEERQSLLHLSRHIECFQTDSLYAVGNAGALFTGLYREDSSSEHLLKISRNKEKQTAAFARVMEVTGPLNLPFLCEPREFAVCEENPLFWYQIQRKIEGMMISQYQALSPTRRLQICDPVVICIDILEHSRALHDLRIIAPNIDAENVIIQPDSSLVRIDLDPYQHIKNGKLPRHPLRRLFKLILIVLADFESIWREDISRGRISCDLDSYNRLFERLRASSIHGYDDSRKSRHRRDSQVDPRDCYNDPKEPLGALCALSEALEMRGALSVGGA